MIINGVILFINEFPEKIELLYKDNLIMVILPGQTIRKDFSREEFVFRHVTFKVCK